METAFRSDERFTQAQFSRWLDENAGFLTGQQELIDGAIVMSPPARYQHGILEVRLTSALFHCVERHRLGRVCGTSTGYELPSGDTLAPDASFLSHERLAAGPSPDPEQFLRIVPELVIEVLSPSTARRDRTEKKDIYAKNGVDEYWLVDPKLRRVSVLHRRGSSLDEVTEYASGRIPSRVLPQLELTIEDLFADLD